MEEINVLKEENKKLNETIKNFENNFTNESLDQDLFDSSQTIHLIEKIKNTDRNSVYLRTPEDMRSITLQPLSDNSYTDNMNADNIERSDNSLEGMILDDNQTDNFVCEVTSTKETLDSPKNDISGENFGKQAIDSEHEFTGQPKVNTLKITKVNPLKIKKIIPATKPNPQINYDESTRSID